jgi:hypothetical protein
MLVFKRALYYICLKRNESTRMKRLFLLAAFSAACLAAAAQPYWNQHQRILPLRAPVGERPEFMDLNGDGRQDAVKSYIAGDVPILWLDEDGNMAEGALEGDTVNDCLLVDRDKDGAYDFIVKFADLTGNGVPDMQLILDYPVGGRRTPNFMYVFDDDKDGVFNYVDWSTLNLLCWEKNGLSDFYTDYSGNSTFLKTHRVSQEMDDLRYQWENPFLFYDYDGDGLTEMAVRFCDTPFPNADSKARGFEKTQYQGWMGWFSMGIDMDNDNVPGNDFDFDMTLHYSAQKGFNYSECVHPLRNMRGLPEADRFFPDPRFRLLTELIYPDRHQAFDKAFAGQWESARFTWDEDDDCGRWERVELYEDRDAFPIGTRNNGLDNHPQADVSGDRGEWDRDFSGGGDIYVGRFDGRVHLYGAERGAWRIDQNTLYYQGWNRSFQNTAPSSCATVEYLDTDGNGFLDTVCYDLDGDRTYECRISLAELGLDDRCEVLDVSKMKYKDYTKLFKKVSDGMWKRAKEARKVAEACGIPTLWYAKLLSPKSLRERYHYGWWFQFYVYKDLEDRYVRAGDAEALKRLHRAYYSGDWKSLL